MTTAARSPANSLPMNNHAFLSCSYAHDAESLLPGGRGALTVSSAATPTPRPVGKRSRCTEPPRRCWGLWGLNWRGAANERRIARLLEQLVAIGGRGTRIGEALRRGRGTT